MAPSRISSNPSSAPEKPLSSIAEDDASMIPSAASRITSAYLSCCTKQLNPQQTSTSSKARPYIETLLNKEIGDILSTKLNTRVEEKRTEGALEDVTMFLVAIDVEDNEVTALVWFIVSRLHGSIAFLDMEFA
ncbi:hypothetical protein I350_00991 [Cryptococcus amylolentus CBS 6273]|uniref:Uncharacterized protein n=1 Tax=Cryptococcus amylolentus CBS 6273 TaxID=1296118 RepID=A0A1E3KBP0_9TREE|nr:hypothetical protein I350_00991 [Cryptococcus amylolentus CBS 6273]